MNYLPIIGALGSLFAIMWGSAFWLMVFEKKQKMTMTEQEANEMQAAGKAKKLKYLGDGKWEVRILTQKQTIVLEPFEEDVHKEDIAKKETIIYEIMRKKGEAPIIMKSGNIKKKKEFIDFKLQGVWRRYFPNNFIHQSVKGKNRIIARFNPYYSEALKVGQLEPDYDIALENHLLYDWAQQYKKAIGAVAGLLAALARDRSIQLLLLMAFVFGIPIGMALWPQIISTPNTVVHWAP